LDKATAIRQKQLAEFNGEEKDLLQSISSLKAGITILSKHSSMMQMPESHVAGLAASVQNAMEKHSAMLAGVLTHSERRAVSAFVQAPTYNAQSGEIFGILKQMKETFETNLASSQKDENANQKAYEDLKKAKENEIKAGQAQLDTKTQELADTNEKNAQAKEDTQDTKKSLAADQKFLAMLKEKCTITDSEWEQRQKTRQLEMEAVSKALAVLSSDDAHDLFTKTFNPSFLQVEEGSDRRVEVSKLLSAVAQKVQNPRLATLATRVRLDAFTRVKKAINDMVVQLAKEGADEIKHKDFCVDEFNKNEQQTERKIRAKQDVKAKMEDLALTMKQLTQAVDKLKGEIAEMQVQLKRAGADRATETKEFQMTIADQRATQTLLTAAIKILKGFYAKKAALLQAKQPAGFESYKNNAAAPGVIGMIQQIINDAKAMEAEAIRSEEDGQAAYEAFVKETNGSISAKSKDIVNKSQNKAKAEAGLVEAKEDKSAVVLELEQLGNVNAELHQSCDYVLKNFEIRQTARSEEIEALKQAKAILGGAKFAFLQTTVADDSTKESEDEAVVDEVTDDEQENEADEAEDAEADDAEVTEDDSEDVSLMQTDGGDDDDDDALSQATGQADKDAPEIDEAKDENKGFSAEKDKTTEELRAETVGADETAHDETELWPENWNKADDTADEETL